MVFTHISTSTLGQESPELWERNRSILIDNSSGGKTSYEDELSITPLPSESSVLSNQRHTPVLDVEESRGSQIVDHLESAIASVRNLNIIEKQSCSSDTYYKEEQKPNVISREIDEAYLDWDPLKAHNSSLINLNCRDAPSLFTGVTDYHGALCPHADSTGSCYKGARCPHKYHIDQNKIAKNEKLAVPVVNSKVTLYPKLPKQNRCVNGMTFIGQITSVTSPSEFYVVPKGKPQCITALEPQIKENDELEKLTMEMEDYYYAKTLRNAANYLKLELVAVQYVFLGRKRFYRGVVIEDAIVEDDENPSVEIYLLDIGIKVTLDFFSVSPLAEFFCHLPPLAYKCSLFGVNPLYLTYSKCVNDIFEDLVNTKEVCVIIRQSYKPKKVLGTNEDGAKSCIVELLIKTQESPCLIPVHEILAKHGHVKIWNKDLWRPIHGKHLTEIQSQLLISKTKKAFQKQVCGNNRIAEDKAYKQFLTDTAVQIDSKEYYEI